MPRNGTTGIYTRTDGTRTGTTVWTQAKNAGVKIVSSGHDTHDQDIATALNDCLTQDNKIKPTANFLPNADGTLDLGSSSVTWNNQYLKGNLHLIDGQNDGARFYNSANYVELRAPGTLAANRVFTLPNTLGSAGNFLQTDGSGNLSWQTGSGAYNKISATTAAGGAPNISITADGSTYRVFELVLDAITVTASTTLRLLVSNDSGSNYVGTDGRILLGNGTTATSSSGTPLDIGDLSSTAGNELMATIRIYTNLVSSASSQPRFAGQIADSTNVRMVSGRFTTSGTSPITNIRLATASGTGFTGGTIRLYGISN